MATRQERMIAVAKQRDCPSNYIDFEVVDYKEMKPGISILTYSYISEYESMRSTTTSWLMWNNDCSLAGGVLHTDFDR